MGRSGALFLGRAYSLDGLIDPARQRTWQPGPGPGGQANRQVPRQSIADDEQRSSALDPWARVIPGDTGGPGGADRDPPLWANGVVAPVVKVSAAAPFVN